MRMDTGGQLQEMGYLFRGTSDTEVLLYLYEEYGLEGMLDKLDGMYAIGVLDKKKNCVYLARDKIGEKPLYVYQDREVFLWASEYKAFYCHPCFKPELNEGVLTEYLMFRYITNGKTLLKGVKNLKPGSYLMITPQSAVEKIYWTLPDVKQKETMSKEECKTQFGQLLKKAVSSRMVSDLEVGIQLSGGVDSSFLTYQASQMVRNRLKTFGIVFDGKEYSEKAYMDTVIAKCGVEAEQYNFGEAEFLKSWKETTYFFEAPMNHEGTLGVLYLNKRAKEKITVMLCGEGADETLGGYPRFALFSKLSKRPFFRRARVLRRMLREKDIKGYLPSLWNYQSEFIQANQFVKSKDVRKLYVKANVEGIFRKRKKIMDNTPGRGIRQLMNYEVRTYLQDLLMRADKASMASAVEVRVPFLMPELVEYVCTVPDHFLVREEGKLILKEAVAEIFGKDFAYRKKRGFGIPLMDYFTKGAIRAYIEEVLLPGIQQRHLLEYGYIMRVWKGQVLQYEKNGTYDSSKVELLWVAFSLELWASIFLDGKIYEREGTDGIKGKAV